MIVDSFYNDFLSDKGTRSTTGRVIGAIVYGQDLEER